MHTHTPSHTCTHTPSHTHHHTHTHACSCLTCPFPGDAVVSPRDFSAAPTATAAQACMWRHHSGWRNMSVTPLAVCCCCCRHMRFVSLTAVTRAHATAAHTPLYLAHRLDEHFHAASQPHCVGEPSCIPAVKVCVVKRCVCDVVVVVGCEKEEEEAACLHVCVIFTFAVRGACVRACVCVCVCALESGS